MSRASALVGGGLFLAPLLSACAGHAPGPDLLGVDGRYHRPLDARGAHANVVVFTTVDCPIANGYAPEIRAIAGEYADHGVRFYLVHVDPDVGIDEASAHAEAYGYDVPVLLDPRHDLVRELGATTTPEVAVVLPDGKIVYSGRIDNLYADLGVKRSGPLHRDLRDVLAGVVAGEDLPRVRTPPVGCAIPDLP